MADDFIVCIDRIIASTPCFGSVDGRQCDGVGVDPLIIPVPENGGEGCSSSSSSSSSNKDDDDDDVVVVVVECRICQEEDLAQAMEAPCSCNGTLKTNAVTQTFKKFGYCVPNTVGDPFLKPWLHLYKRKWKRKRFAHRKCIQRWCNKKGNTICEICNQAFSPNYSLPPVRSNAIMAIDIRQEWGHDADLHVALASAEQQLLQTEYEDYAMSQTSSIACLRSVTLILLMILLVRQALILTKNSVTGQDASIIFNFEMSVLQFVGVLLPCFAMARSWYAIQNQRRRQG
ncbi:hypothetical protein GLYMA_02G137300v4 [Glycine max]|uniref:RING-CH-type domain-containing protein n=2 Tax=Glycine subgen. Soja TaxID=1462606 RepID=A0A0R0L3B4_SOYBN|nr:uncharacterized protein LOC100812120 isoform X1 [Glycine max]XP_028205454.1 uncharacterized protein LOC114389051 isoform X2 [Glycine soja]KAH1060192.1 hypothetical protein GYH30_003942 [Glycine max]KRH71219.1 hypothetical protein GLYMA_02G137300v4 [Glycine max]RZC24859.1 hypothetical protein D0Y65_003851 [Glycine soja]|eukprot:XP_006574460.1 uncharacterized protein LOC100812120 isoform X2 [Glycine max]